MLIIPVWNKKDISNLRHSRLNHYISGWAHWIDVVYRWSCDLYFLQFQVRVCCSSQGWIYSISNCSINVETLLTLKSFATWWDMNKASTNFFWTPLSQCTQRHGKRLTHCMLEHVPKPEGNKLLESMPEVEASWELVMHWPTLNGLRLSSSQATTFRAATTISSQTKLFTAYSF